MMDEPASWPAWKFGMKQEDLYTKLHDKYNTYLSFIQDEVAFHHDIFEISNEAKSVAEFHYLAANRKQMRLHELEAALESASFEIVANPRLISTPQWQHALQLFRTKSLDSLVCYFASYLPADHHWYAPDNASTPAITNLEPGEADFCTGSAANSASSWPAVHALSHQTAISPDSPEQPATAPITPRSPDDCSGADYFPTEYFSSRDEGGVAEPSPHPVTKPATGRGEAAVGPIPRLKRSWSQTSSSAAVSPTHRTSGQNAQKSIMRPKSPRLFSSGPLC